MVAIPSTKDTDSEDVVWGLQTAEALWKRGERIDAIVWLRRAAQAAGDSADDDRALELARAAAELSDWMATEPPLGTDPPPPMGTVPPAAEASRPPPVDVPPPPPDLFATPQAPQRPYDPHNAATFVPFGDEGGAPAAPSASPGASQRPMPPMSRPPSQPTIQTAEPFFPLPEAPPPAPEASLPTPVAPAMSALDDAPLDSEPGAKPSVPPAEHVHAGMFNPWEDGALPAPQAAPQVPAARFSREEEEVITSVKPQLPDVHGEASGVVRASSEAPPLRNDTPPPPPVPSAKPAPGRPPPLPARAKKPPVPGSTQAAPLPPSAPSIPRASAAPMPPSAPSIPRASAAPMPPRPPMAPTPPAPPPSARALPVAPPRPARVTPAPPTPTQVIAQPETPRPAEAQVQVQVPEAIESSGIPVDLSTEPGPIAVEPSEAELPKAPSEPPAPPPLVAAAPVEPPAPAPAAPAPAAPVAAAKLDLDSVEAFSDLPDDARAAFAAAAKVSALAEGEEVSGFALAYMLEGTVDVAATMVDAPAARLAAGAVLRSRGTTDEGVPMRLIGVSSGIVATWTDAEVQDAFRTCPWVEEDLRTAADRMQTLVGVTIGPLGERLDAAIREQIIERLTMKTLVAGDVVVTKGEPMVGLILIGVGELELMEGDKVAGVVGSGEFLFATEVLGGGDVPRTARAGAGGALILYGDRHIAQELLVTCPPLLEVFAGM